MTSGGYAVVTTAYFPPVEYFMAAAATEHLLIEDSESYVKQSYRNRCRIYACDGILSLTVPVSAPDGDRRRFLNIIRTMYSPFWILVRRLFLNSIRLLQSGCWNCWG